MMALPEPLLITSRPPPILALPVSPKRTSLPAPPKRMSLQAEVADRIVAGCASQGLVPAGAGDDETTPQDTAAARRSIVGRWGVSLLPPPPGGLLPLLPAGRVATTGSSVVSSVSLLFVVSLLLLTVAEFEERPRCAVGCDADVLAHRFSSVDCAQLARHRYRLRPRAGTTRWQRTTDQFPVRQGFLDLHAGGGSRSNGIRHRQGVGEAATDRHGVSTIGIVYREGDVHDDCSLFDVGIVGRGIC